MSPTQQSLLPQRTPRSKRERVPVAELRRLRLSGPRPTADMIETVRSVGVVVPVILFRPTKGAWKVGDGIRRILAAIEAGREWIPADVYEEEQDFRHAITLITNNQRSPNPLAEVRSIMALQKRRYSVEQIAEQTRIPRARIELRLQLLHLIKPLWDAVFKRTIGVSVAQACCKLPVPYQQRLAAKLKRDGTLTLNDVREIKSVRQNNALESMPADIFDAPPDTVSLMRERFQAFQDELQTVLHLADPKCRNLCWQIVDMRAVLFGEPSIPKPLREVPVPACTKLGCDLANHIHQKGCPVYERLIHNTPEETNGEAGNKSSAANASGSKDS